MLTFEDILRKSQQALKKALMSELNHLGYKTQTKQGFIYAKGTLPVMLVAHLDTVHKEQVQLICYSTDKSIVMSPQGIGGDDRAGVYMILQIIKKHRCHVLFCEDEEIGGIGASAFVKSGINPKINYIVELDRRGTNDVVFYDCDNSEFTKFVTGFGFKEQVGSFSDIAIVAPELGITAVNISAGYFNEHSKSEYVDLNAVAKNIERVGEMVSAKSDAFEYIEAVYFPRGIWDSRYYEDVFDFRGYYNSKDKIRIKTLMPLPDFAYVTLPNGDLEENFGDYFMDEAGAVYEYLYDLDVALETKGFQAKSASGLPMQFSLKDCTEVEIVPFEYVCDVEFEQSYISDELP
jgi:hypothetical protein